MLPIRVVTHTLVSPLVMARGTPPLLLAQVRTLSKVVQSDKWRIRKSKKTKIQEKVLGSIANEGRKLADSRFLSQSDFLDEDTSLGNWVSRDADDKRGKSRRKKVTDVTAPSTLFIKSHVPPKQSAVKKSLFEEHSEFTFDFINKLLYKNPFNDMKRDPYDLNYPIDNQDGQEAEKGVSFTEHVMLDDLYEDFPKSGPIRNFIELVITGLSQNPYLTPAEKREHVAWFRKEIDTLTPADIEKIDSHYDLEVAKRVRWKRLNNKNK